MASEPHRGAGEALFLVWLETEDEQLPGDGPDMFRLAEGLYLVRSAESRSGLYHAVKRRTRPEKLFVARLDGPPKFKGMAEGALKWVRGR